MKRKISLIIALVIVFTTILSFTALNFTKMASAAPLFQRVDFVNAVVTATSLNVRQGPGTNYPVVCVIYKGQTVKVFGKIGDWYAICEPQKMCVGVAHSSYLKATYPAASPAPTAKPPVATAKPPVATAKPPAVTAVPKPTQMPPATGISSPPASPMQGVSQDEQAMLNLVNKARADAGLGSLQFDMNLVKVARIKAQDMVDNNYFDHNSPTYGSPFDMMRQFDISFRTAGENIAGNQSVQGAFNAWMNSEGHRKNILGKDYNYTGIGIVASPKYGKMFVQQFIGR